MLVSYILHRDASIPVEKGLIPTTLIYFNILHFCAVLFKVQRQSTVFVYYQNNKGQKNNFSTSSLIKQN
jgi:hypothetical protein